MFCFSSITEKSIQVMVIDPVEAYNAHAMFGSSLTVVNSLLDGQVADQQPELFIGGPEGVNCDKRTPTGDDSLSFDSIGYVYSTTVTYSARSDIVSFVVIIIARFQGSDDSLLLYLPNEMNLEEKRCKMLTVCTKREISHQDIVQQFPR